MYSYECCLVDIITCALLPQKGAIRRSWWVDSQPWNQAWVCVHWPAAMREPYQGHSWLFFYCSPRLLTGESAVAFWHINPKLWPEPTTTVKYVYRPGLCVQPKGTPLVQTHDNHRRSEQGRPQRSYMVYKSSPQSLWNQGPVLWKTILPQTRVRGGVVSGWFKCIAFIVHFIIIITSAPLQIIRN